jgi:hypothetical protein
VKKPDVIQKNELYFSNQGSNVIQNQLSKSKHRLKSFVLQACVITTFISGQRKIQENYLPEVFNIGFLWTGLLSDRLASISVVDPSIC